MSFSSARNAGCGAETGRLFVVSAPSGAGKTTLCRAAREQFPDLLYSVSFTTRLPRPGETDGSDYHFIEREAFEKGIREKRWAEWAVVHGNYYGTCAAFIEGNLQKGKDILMDIDVQGAEQILKRYPEAVTIFVEPPSLEVLRHRLESRKTDRPDEIDRRMDEARKEMAKRHLYRHVILNERLEPAVQELAGIIEAYRR
ncbi:MAG: guanylate kinase [Desulfobacteraceae bacterium]|nr:MAG: guanylate kinase [Desulfobacteraceae bacterium]